MLHCVRNDARYMKILYTLNSGVPGGMEQHVLDLVSQMLAHGHEVYVWCNGGVIYDWYKKAGAKVTEKTIRDDIDITYIKELRQFLKENKIQIVHAHELKAVANTLLAGFWAGVKVRITHQHTPFTDWQVPKSKRLIYDIFYSLAVNILATREIALTKTIKQLKMQAGITQKKLAVIPNGIDTYKFFVAENEREIYRKEVCKKYRIDPSTKIIGNISRTTKEKGHDLLIRAFAELLSDKNINRAKYTLMICGGGDLEEDLWTLAGELGVKDLMVITGRFDDDLKLKFYSAFDYFVFPTLAEGFGIVLIEALICGLPVLCSDMPVLKEVGGQFPLYFKLGEYQDLAEKLVDILEKPRDDGQQKSYIEKNYSLEKFGENYHKLYESCLKI